MTKIMARIIVTGYMIRHPVAGNMLAYFHYILGFLRLGHEVYYLEESGWPGACYNPLQGSYGDDASYGIRAVQVLMARYNADVPLCYVNRDSGHTEGIAAPELEHLLSSADLLLNLGGVCSLPQFDLSPRRVLIDMDPLFTQLGRFANEDLERYDVYLSYGANIGQPGCTVPCAGLVWAPTAPPVVPDLWQDISTVERRDLTDAPYTTICNWSAYGFVDYKGERYGQKDEEFARLLELPSHVSQPLELALAGANAETRQRFRAAGWSIRDAAEVSNDVSSYRSYIAASRGELSAAKNAYVRTRSGWFSDRSVCYLAAGRPVVVQDTGISDWMTTGHGVLTFSTMNQAIDCIEQIESNYAGHCASAREIAEEVFSYKVVLPRILEWGFADTRGPARDDET
jgi:hypothetical protein